MPKTIQAPDGKMIDFPDTMDDPSIAAAMRRLYPPKQTTPMGNFGSISAAPDRSWPDRVMDVLRNSPIGYSLQSTMPRVANALGMTPNLTVNAPEYQAAKTGDSGIINLPQLIDANQDPTLGGYAKSAARGVLGVAGGMTRPDNAAMMLGGLGPLQKVRALQLAFAGQMTEGAATGAVTAYHLARQGRWNEAFEQAGGSAASIYFARKGVEELGKDIESGTPKTELNPTPKVPDTTRPGKATAPPKEVAKETAKEAAKDAANKKPEDKKAEEATPLEAKKPFDEFKLISQVKTLGKKSPTRIKAESTPKGPALGQTEVQPLPAVQTQPGGGMKVTDESAMSTISKDLEAKGIETLKPSSVEKRVPSELAPKPIEGTVVPKTPVDEKIDLAAAQKRLQEFEAAKQKSESQPKTVATPEPPSGATPPAPKANPEDIIRKNPGLFRQPEERPEDFDSETGERKKKAEAEPIVLAQALSEKKETQAPFDPTKVPMNAKVRVKLLGQEQEGTVEQNAPKGMKVRIGAKSYMIQHKDVLGRVDEPQVPKTQEVAEQTPPPPPATSTPFAKPPEAPRAAEETGKPVQSSEGITAEQFSQAVKDHPELMKMDPAARQQAVKDIVEGKYQSVQKRVPSKSAPPAEWKGNPLVYQGLKDHIAKYIPEGYPQVRKQVLDAALKDYQEMQKDPRQAAMAFKVAKQKITEAFDKPKPPDDIEMGMGLIPPGFMSKIGGVIDNFADFLKDKFEVTPDEQLARNIIRRGSAQLAASKQEAADYLKAAIDRHKNDGEAELRAFMDSAEGKPGAAPLSPEDQVVADWIHDEFEKRWPILQKINPDRLQGPGIVDYLKHLWLGPKGRNTMERILLGKRPLEGPRTFLKHRYYEFLSDGLDAGLIPSTYNPIDMQLAGMFEIDRYITAHDMASQMKAAGIVKFFKPSQMKNIPDGWGRLNDRIFKPAIMKKGVVMGFGEYWAPKEVADTFNRYLSPGLRGNWLYDKVRAFGNFQNQLQLGFSAYHGTFSTLNSSISDMAMAIQRLANAKDVFDVGLAARDAIHAIPGWSAFQNYQLGKRLESEVLRPGSTDPTTAIMADVLKRGGGRIGIDPMYENQAVETWRRTLVRAKMGDAKAIAYSPVAGIQALAEVAARPIMKYYVPRLKLGVFARMASQRLGELARNGVTDPEVWNAELGKTWDSVDNRMGQLVYDNLFWHKTIKDLSFLSVRSVGWDLGTAREIGGGGVDFAKALYDMKQGKRPEMSQRLAYTVALPLTVGMVGAVYGYLSGHPPQQAMDYFFPRTGGVNSDGKEEHISLPSYMKDLASIWHEPFGKYAVSKLHPTIQAAADIMRNEDYYGTEIRDNQEPWLKQAWQVAEYVVKGFTPFGVSNTYHRLQAGENILPSMGATLGFTPAPKWITESPAEQLASQYYQRQQEQGPHTQAEREQYETFSRAREQYHAGKMSEKQIDDMLFQGKITDTQYDSIFEEEDMTPLQKMVSRIHDPGLAMRVYQKATPAEKATLDDVMDSKFDKLDPDNPSQEHLYEIYERELYSNQ